MFAYRGALEFIPLLKYCDHEQINENLLAVKIYQHYET
jgi:hypothetical protein